jgi:hypothetical protein
MDVPVELRELVATTWKTSWRVEFEAGLRFDKLVGKLESVGTPAELVDLARAACEQERTHSRLCGELAQEFGAALDAPLPEGVPEIAPAGLGPRERVLYEVVAACCVTETTSCGSQTLLLAADPEPAVKAVLHTIARDEVGHSRLGWAHLTFEASRGDVRFLGELVPMMLGDPASPWMSALPSEVVDDPRLMRFGVLPRNRRREEFATMLREVVFPGLARYGIDTDPSRAWLDARVPPAA